MNNSFIYYLFPIYNLHFQFGQNWKYLTNFAKHLSWQCLWNLVCSFLYVFLYVCWFFHYLIFVILLNIHRFCQYFLYELEIITMIFHSFWKLDEVLFHSIFICFLISIQDSVSSPHFLNLNLGFCYFVILLSIFHFLF